MLYITLYYMENVKHQDLKCALIIYALYPQKEYTSKEWQRIAFYLLTCGYCKENFEVDTNGVDPKWIEKIKEYM